MSTTINYNKKEQKYFSRNSHKELYIYWNVTRNTKIHPIFNRRYIIFINYCTGSSRKQRFSQHILIIKSFIVNAESGILPELQFLF